MLKAVSGIDPSAAVDSVSNSDGTLTISPTTGAVIASIALGHANTWTGTQNFDQTTNPGINIDGVNGITYPSNDSTADGTIIIGKSAGASLTGSSALSDTLIGYQAGTLISTGTQNTILGFQAGAAITTGGGNTLFGYQAGNAIAGTQSLGGITAIGRSAGSKDDGTTGNVYIGDQAGLNNVSGAECVYIGRQSGTSATGSSNTFVGLNSFTASTSSGSNTGVGQDTQKFATGHDNTSVGQSAMKNVVGTNNNTAIGSGAMLNVASISGDGNNVAIGLASLSGTTASTFSACTAVGVNTGLNMTSGQQNNLFGVSAGVALTTGGQNVFIGNNAGNNITTGGDLIIINTSRSNTPSTGVTTGTSDAIAIGNNTKVGSSDLAVGLGALAATSENSNVNMAFGHNAGNKLTSGDRNLVLGTDVASTTLTTGSNNILIGTSNTVDTPASSTSGYLNIGNAITATGLGGTLQVTYNGGVVNAIRVVTAAGTAAVTTSDYTIVINKTVGAATPVTLPATPVTGAIHIIKDGKGDAATNNITISPAAGNIDGSSTFVMSTNYQSVALQYNATQWNVL